MNFIGQKINTRCINCSCMSKAFRQLQADELETIDLNRTEITYKKGESLCKQGSFMSYMMFVKSGMVKVYIENEEKSPTVISLESCGHFVGLPFLLSKHKIYQYTVEAVTDCKVCLVDLDIFERMIHTNGGFAKELMIMSNQELLKSYNHIFSLTQKQITGRFAEFILYLKDQIHQKPKFELALSKREMAEMIATTQESMSRLLKQFSDDKLIKLNKHQLTILDEAKLRYLSKVA